MAFYPNLKPLLTAALCFAALAPFYNSIFANSHSNGANGIGVPVRALAQNHVELVRSSDPKNICTYTPAILVADNKRIVAAYEFGGLPKIDGKRQPNAHILTSDDGGKTWTERACERMSHGRLFKSGQSLYYLGHSGNLRIMRSDDNGETWSKAFDLTDPKKNRDWHQSACNVWHDSGKVYLTMEHRNKVKNMKRGWKVAELAPVVMRAKEGDDLTKIENWTFSNEVCAASLIEGFASGDLPWDYFGVPFYKHNYPQGTPVRKDVHHKTGKEITRRSWPLGILESNIVKITDPDHYWYDPSGKTFHILARCNTSGTGYAALLKAVEKDDGSIEVGLEKVPSGKKCLFIPLPGGQMRFHILYDDKTKLFWLLSTQATDSMTRAEKLDKERFNLPYDERQRMVLHFSKNLVDWCFAGLVAKGDSPKQARHYACMDIDGDDLIILSRSGDADAKSAHDGNIITFHRVKNFRDLVY